MALENPAWLGTSAGFLRAAADGGRLTVFIRPIVAYTGVGMGSDHHLEQLQRIPRPCPEVFTFFSDPANLERLTPPFLKFRILSPQPIILKPGALIDYTLRLNGIPVRWRTQIEAVDPGRSFSDVQLRGPYRRWHHRHEFREIPGGTEMKDTVDYALPFGVLGALANPLFVRPSLRRIFTFRRQVVEELFGTFPPSRQNDDG
jgi:ligand-binding SRPBCC domain-containing protein